MDQVHIGVRALQRGSTVCLVDDALVQVGLGSQIRERVKLYYIVIGYFGLRYIANFMVEFAEVEPGPGIGGSASDLILKTAHFF